MKYHLQEEINKLPARYHEDFSTDFLGLLAALRLLGFSILHAHEGRRDIVLRKTNLWAEIGHPSVCVQAPEALELIRQSRTLERNTPEYVDCSNKIIQANLVKQRLLLEALDEFYRTHTAPSFYARLIVETVDDFADSYLKPQGGSVRVIADADEQRRLYEESRGEILAFSDFLSEKFL